jgi:hypothetical protein
MGERPSGMTLDRMNGNLGYEPSNCRWATPKEQGNNTAANHLLEFRGKRQTISLWSDELGIKANTIVCRIRRGWSTERALTAYVISRMQS